MAAQLEADVADAAAREAGDADAQARETPPPASYVARLAASVVRAVGVADLARAREALLGELERDKQELLLVVGELDDGHDANGLEDAVRAMATSSIDAILTDATTLRAMLLSIRVALTVRALGELAAWERFAAEPQASPAEGEALARKFLTTMSTTRAHARQTLDGQVWADPVMLALEYEAGIIMWRSQVESIRACVSAAQKGESRVQQMIMGAGKSSVVLPLVSGLLTTATAADALVVLAQPVALLSAARSITSRVLGGGAFARRVVSLDFSRACLLYTSDAADDPAPRWTGMGPARRQWQRPETSRACCVALGAREQWC